MDAEAIAAGKAWVPRFNFCMQVWGVRYVETMLAVGLPSQLTAGNLLDFPWLSDSVYEIYTTREDECLIVASNVFQRLARLMRVEFYYIDDVMSDNKWPVVRHCHREGVKSADARNAALFFLCPDQVWMESSFRNAAARIVEGYTAVLCPGPRAVLEDFLPEARRRYLSADRCSLPIPARDLVKLGIDHLHPEMKAWFWDAPNYYKFPTYMMFDVPGEGISAFCYILHPVVLNAQVRNAPFRMIFDQDYLEAACPDVERIYVAQDTDEVFHFELTVRDAPIPPPPYPDMDPIKAMWWYGEWQHNEQHRQFVKRPIRIHYTECTGRRWSEVEARVFDYVRRIDAGWRTADWVLMFVRPYDYLRRIEGRYRFAPDAISTGDRFGRALASFFVAPAEVSRRVPRRLFRMLPLGWQRWIKATFFGVRPANPG